ncbi:peptidase domain-containing ABC transporter [Paludibacter sp.]|uniref:peptidase domain-containing ABC transporter n=1 Tax=Paludibacter sp. TaxID=1898105 RepID=UPI001355538E|nr:peptidase domain-containing ABC transporter [Paludibacter sp.]MTK52081.1 peptidase domain-containing ABC transporter [Paludibacter sp.]
MRFPLFLQHDTMDCGPTCLRMIAAYYGRSYSLEGLREKSRLTREGVSMLGVSEAAEQIGFRTTGIIVPFGMLKDAPLPCIVHWNQQHFVVVYKIKELVGLFGNKSKEVCIYVADPAAGKVKYTQQEFCRCWYSSKVDGEEVGTALLLEPTPDFYKKDEEIIQRKGFHFLFSYLRPYRSLILQLFLGLAFGSLLQLVLPFLTQSIVDFGINTHNVGYIYLVLAAQLMLTFSSAAVEFIRGWILLHLGVRINISLISDFLIKLMRLPMGYFDTKMVGDILQRINDHTRIKDYLTNSSLSVLFSAVTIVIFSIVLLLYNPLIFSIFFVGSALYFGWVWIFMKRRAELDNKNFAQQSANQSNVVQLITGMQEIKLNGCEQQKRWEWERIQAKLFRLRIRGLALSQYQDSGGVLINQTKNIIITALVAKLVIDGQLTLGMMLAVQYIIGQLNSPIDHLISFIRDTQDAQLSINRLSEIHSKEDEESKDENRIAEIPSNQALTLRNVRFSYDGTSVGEPVVNDVSLIIPSGKQTAIVGTSGSGKTTLVKLLLGFYPLQKGEILLGNNNLTNFNLRAWRKQCGVVMQDGFIFSDTIARNIAPGVEVIDKEKLLNAVVTANIRDFVESLPLGYNTKIGNEGHGLSQGQKQRILIARSVYKDPAFVFLDEATNALDTNNESVIMSNLQNFFKGRTSVVVAHRLSTVKNADQIVVLEKGEIAEIGTHNQLIQQQGAYYRLVKNQLEL